MARAEVTTLMVPHQVNRTGVRRGLLEDLALKILYLHGEMSLLEMSERTCLSLGVIEEIFQFFRKEQLCEVKRMAAGSQLIARKRNIVAGGTANGNIWLFQEKFPRLPIPGDNQLGGSLIESCNSPLPARCILACCLRCLPDTTAIRSAARSIRSSP